MSAIQVNRAIGNRGAKLVRVPFCLRVLNTRGESNRKRASIGDIPTVDIVDILFELPWS